MSKLGIYKFNSDRGRHGNISGVFIEEAHYVEYLLKSNIQVYFGEVLGKHSNIYGPIYEGEITLSSDDPGAVKVVQELDLSSGINPFYCNVVNFDYDEAGIDKIGEDDMTVYELITLLLERE